MSFLTLTATTDSECQCCLIDTPAPFQCRTRGGTATICGTAEYTTPSVPPKLYRTTTLAGGLYKCEWDGANCTGNAGNFCSNYAGQYLFDKNTCAQTNAQTETRNITPSAICAPPPGPYSTSTPTGLPLTPDTFGLSSDQVLVTTRTVLTWTYGSAGCLSPVANRTWGGSITSTLSDEDLESDAIARLLAGGGGTWSAWTTGGDGSGGTCIPKVCCLARYEQRTTLFSFVYQEAQIRVTYSGLEPSKSYLVAVKIWRRSFGVDPYVLFQTLLLNATTDGSGNLSIDADIPNTVGFETYSASASVLVPRT